ncbi:PREDICTED: protein FAM90A1 [Propithecus coquereli]|uniref:protein FAM90A1 n=1 Tax=Propithecus coquereli TaxID=379532 RepID=UPI00063FADF4|nr:PREDICTED: protein FAM90A1 [Propithecus coquereli]
MDPNTLSMEQGKQLLKQCGIPQRDIDLMTEKYVVLASVEVLLRFPLMPGENPTARCVSDKKCQPSVDPTHAISGRCGDQEERKSNNQLMSKTNKKSNNVKQVAGHYLHHQPQRPSNAKTPGKQRRPVGQRAPLAEEEEAGVKCKNCRAFGDTARSTRCPMKCWDGALPLQPLGSNKEKENLKPTKPQQLQAPAPFKDNNGEQEQRHRQEQQRRAAPGTFPRRPQEAMQRDWEELAEPCPYLRQPTMPPPVQTTKKRPAPNSVPKRRPPVKTPESRSFFPSCHNKRPELSTSGPTKGHERGFTDSPHPALKRCSQDPTGPSSPTCPWLSARQAAHVPEVFSHTVLQPSVKALAPGPVFKPQARIKRPDADSKPRPQPVRQERGQDSTRRIREWGKRPVPVPNQTYPNPQKKARLSSFPTPQLGTRRPDPGTVQALQPPRRTSGLGPSQAPKVTAKTAPAKEAALQPGAFLQPLPVSALLSPAQDPVPQPHPSSHGPGQPSRAASPRCDEGLQSSALGTAPRSRAPGRAARAARSPRVSAVSERRGPGVPRSVLYEDLLVSSSSEDSDGE